ncbi:DUF819 family protein [Membranicola marinus]|uniref:DUF819 family protein n=1 Tax=Membranihabitans marinus TaxID=1227546 RepID=A0A953HQF5_9BACT|nr:DUF819 family protein [Membranihabitans marinus]MBY5959872.1 DUF819 family protein [Membranihabitans marinus]
MEAIFTNDAVVLGILIVVLALVFYTSGLPQKGWQRFYTFFPPLLLCYFVPAVLVWPLGLIDDPDDSLYYMSSRFLLPAALILLCLNIDFKGLIRLGPKALIMFFTATAGIVLGGPIAILFLHYVTPGLIEMDPHDLWTGMSTIAGSWIGGGANQTAMKEIFDVNDTVFSSMVVVDIIVANIWMAVLLYGAGMSDRIDRWLKADSSAITELRKTLDDYRAAVEQIPTTTQMFVLLGVGFGGVAISHAASDVIVPAMRVFEETLVAWKLQSLLSPFFWMIVVATSVGLGLSFTRVRRFEGYGASKWGSIFIYVLVATIGMKMNFKEIFENAGLFVLGGVWMLTHILLLVLVAKLIRAPFFFVAVGSQANVGGAASAPVVASAFSPSLSAVGVIMAVMGYALGTYFAIVCALLMQSASGV